MTRSKHTQPDVHEIPGDGPSCEDLLLKELRDARDAKGMTQQDLADRLGVTPAWVSNVERGSRKIRSEDDLETLADAIGADFKYLSGLWYDVLLQEKGYAGGTRSPVLPATQNRVAKLRAEQQRESENYLGPGVTERRIRELLQTNPTALKVIRTLCDE